MKKIIIFITCIFCLVGCSSNTKPKEEAPKAKKVAEKQEEKQYQYYYSKLSKSDKKNYNLLYEGIKSSDKSVQFDKMTTEKIEELSSYVRSDHPELFWVEPEFTYMQLKEGKAMSVYPKYNMKKKQVKAMKKQLEEIRDGIIAGIQSEDEYTKVKMVYDYVTQNFEYIEGSVNNQNIMSALINKQTVCAGYAKTVQYLLLSMGMECTLIEGATIDDPNAAIGHAWNMVKVNNDYYYLDATWGDMVNNIVHTCDGYFLMSDAEMLKAYIPDYAYEATTTGNDTWYNREGTYLSSWNSQVISSLWINAINSGRNYIEIKCAPEAMADIRWRLAESGEMYTIMENCGVNVDQFFYVEYTELDTFDIYY